MNTCGSVVFISGQCHLDDEVSLSVRVPHSWGPRCAWPIRDMNQARTPICSHPQVMNPLDSRVEKLASSSV